MVAVNPKSDIIVSLNLTFVVSVRGGVDDLLYVCAERLKLYVVLLEV